MRIVESMKGNGAGSTRVRLLCKSTALETLHRQKKTHNTLSNTYLRVR